MSELKIFELKWSDGEREWMCAHTNIDALITYLSITSMDISDLNEKDEIIEIPKDKWPELKISNTEYDPNDPDDWEEKTFDEYMKDQKSSDIIATTIY